MQQIQSPLYLDHNATTPLLAVAREAMIKSLDIYGNPSSVHAQGRAAKALRENARRQVAHLVNAKPDTVVFTSGASESAVTLLTPHYKMGRADLLFSKLYIGATEHPCIANGGRFAPENIHTIAVDKNGLIDLEDLQHHLANHDQTLGQSLVAIQAANHETGVIQPIEEIAAIVHAAGGVFICDMVQYIGKEPFDMSNSQVDFIIISAHKIGGPKGIGAIIAKGEIMMPVPLIPAGGQERGHRGGTEAMTLIAGFGAAAHFASKNQNKYAELTTLREKLEKSLKKLRQDIVIHGENASRLANTSFFTVPDFKAETLQIAYDLNNIAVSAGSACSSGKVGQSAVLKAMGVEDDIGAIRVSMGHTTTSDDIARFIDTTKTILNR